jgi:very-short-patch-repair endonuclease
MRTKKPTQSKTKPHKRRFAQWMRRNPSRPEALVWERIKNRRLGVRFTRQRPCLGWILDFYCAELCLAIEVDGSHHNAMKDAYRDKVILQQAGIETLRIPASIVSKSLPVAIAIIRRKIYEKSHQHSD